METRTGVDARRRPPAQPRPARAADLFAARYRELTIGLVSTITLVAFEALAVSTIMPTVATDLGQLELIGWVLSGFILGSLVGIVVIGGLVDRGSLIRPFAIALALFACGLLIGGLTPSMPMLVGGRILQGIGAGGVPPVAYVAIGRSLPDSLRPRMFALLSTAWVVPGLIGPAIASQVAIHIHWRAVFLGLLPLILVAGAVALAALRGVPTAEAAAAEANHQRASERDVARDMARRVPYALLVAIGGGLVIAGLSVGRDLTVGAATIDARLLFAVLVGLGLVLLVPAFRRLTPPATLRLARGLPAAVGLRGLLTFAFFSVDAYVPLALQHVRGLDVGAAGLALTAATLTWTGGSWVQARMQDSWGVTRLVALGFASIGLGMLAFGLIFVPSVPAIVPIAAFAFAGLGMGLAYGTLSLAVLRGAPPGGEGQATSGLQLADTLGTAIGIGITGAFVALGERLDDLAFGLRLAVVLAMAVAALGLISSSRLTQPGRTTGMASALR